MFGRKKKKILNDAKVHLAKIDKDLEIITSGRAPRTYVAAKEPITIDDANEIIHNAILSSGNGLLCAGLDVAYVSPGEGSIFASMPLKEVMMAFIQQIDGGQYLTDEYEFIDYYHAAEGKAPRDNKNKEYYILVPIKKE